MTWTAECESQTGCWFICHTSIPMTWRVFRLGSRRSGCYDPSAMTKGTVIANSWCPRLSLTTFRAEDCPTRNGCQCPGAVNPLWRTSAIRTRLRFASSTTEIQSVRRGRYFRLLTGLSTRRAAFLGVPWYAGGLRGHRAHVDHADDHGLQLAWIQRKLRHIHDASRVWRIPNFFHKSADCPSLAAFAGLATMP